VRCTDLDVCFTSMVILALSSEVDFSSSTTGDCSVFFDCGFWREILHWSGPAVAALERRLCGRCEALGGVLRQPPKPALVSRSYRGLPG